MPRTSTPTTPKPKPAPVDVTELSERLGLTPEDWAKIAAKVKELNA